MTEPHADPHADHRLDYIGLTWCLPVMLLMNFGCFQYLLLLFYRRWREPRVFFLLTIAATGFVVLIPYATQDHETIDAMNDVSESCLALLLLVQTVFVGSSQADNTSLAPKMLRWTAGLLVLLDVAVILLGIVAILNPAVVSQFGGANTMNAVSENVTLFFTFLYRFGLLWREEGWRRVLLKDDNWELFWHAVFMTHNYIFFVIENEAGYTWDRIQSVYMRLVSTPCVWMTIGDHHQFHLVRKHLTGRLSLRVARPSVPDNDRTGSQCKIRASLRGPTDMETAVWKEEGRLRQQRPQRRLDQ